MLMDSQNVAEAKKLVERAPAAAASCASLSSALAQQDTALSDLYSQQRSVLALRRVTSTARSIISRDRQRWNAKQEFSYIDIRRYGQSMRTREILQRIQQRVAECSDVRGVLLTDLQAELVPIFRYSKPGYISAMLMRQSDFHTLVVDNGRVRQATPQVVKTLERRHRESRRLRVRPTKLRSSSNRAA